MRNAESHDLTQPKPGPAIEYIEVSRKELGREWNLAFDLLFEEVLKYRKLKAQQSPPATIEGRNTPF
jgi:hypothetical protein